MLHLGSCVDISSELHLGVMTNYFALDGQNRCKHWRIWICYSKRVSRSGLQGSSERSHDSVYLQSTSARPHAPTCHGETTDFYHVELLLHIYATVSVSLTHLFFCQTTSSIIHNSHHLTPPAFTRPSHLGTGDCTPATAHKHPRRTAEVCLLWECWTSTWHLGCKGFRQIAPGNIAEKWFTNSKNNKSKKEHAHKMKWMKQIW